MLTIWKHTFDLKHGDNVFALRMPQGAEILHVADQYGNPCIWLKTETENAPVERIFWLFGTGKRMPEPGYPNLEFVGTVMLERGTLVLHIFEQISK